MSEFRLRSEGLSQAQILALFDETPFKVTPPGGPADREHPTIAEKTLLIGQFEVWITIRTPGIKDGVPDALAESARAAAAQLLELDEAAAHSFDNTVEDGYVAGVRMLSPTKLDLEYWAAHVNSEWNEMFGRDEAGRWRYDGIRKDYSVLRDAADR